VTSFFDEKEFPVGILDAKNYENNKYFLPFLKRYPDKFKEEFYPNANLRLAFLFTKDTNIPKDIAEKCWKIECLNS